MNNGYAICFNKWALDKNIKNEFRLLVIISSLTSETGYCFASNKYLAGIFKETETSISNKIKTLEKNNYIEIEYERRGCEITSRKIRLKNILFDDENNFNSTNKEKFKENNTSINNTSIKESNNINIITKEKKEKYGTYGRVKLTPDEYLRLVNEFGEDFIKNQIDLLDEYIESNNNKNKYTNFNLVLRRSIREKWFDRNNNKGGNNNTKKSFLDIMKEEYDK